MTFIPLSRPLVFFDLETNGLLLDVDRIIEIGLIKIHPDVQTDELAKRFNPGIQIGSESRTIHGISYNM